MATFFDDTSCNSNNWVNNSGNPLTFNPYLLNVTNWIESYKAAGAQSAVLTAKHSCGFTLWPTQVTIPSTGKIYNYSVTYSSYTNDIVQEFSQNCAKYGLGYGFYYSLPNNFYLGLQNGGINSNLLPGQVNVSEEEFEEIALGQLTELFSEYGNFSEFWFDGGTLDFSDKVGDLISKYQSNAAIFNGQDVSQNMVRWIGTESGIIGGPIWSLGESQGLGDPNSTQFCPACVDTTLQTDDHWFYKAGQSIRDLGDLITVYHDSVGNNGVLELDFAIDKTGNVNSTHAARYKEFGDWIRSCYGQSIMSTNGTIENSNNNNNNGNKNKNGKKNKRVTSNNGLSLVLGADKNVQFDRIMIRENLLMGQRVRSFDIYINGTNVYSSTAVGNKRIVLFSQTYHSPATISLNITNFVGDSVDIINFSVFAPCSSS